MFAKLVTLIVLMTMSLQLVSSHYGSVDGGKSESYYERDHHGYKFGYDISDHLGASNSRHESGDGHGHVHGSYSLRDVDGRSRHVKYQAAPKAGFQAYIESNEPGVVPHYAANAPYNAGSGY